MPDHLDAMATRFLTKRYLLALGIVAILTLVAQAIIQLHLQRQRDDARVMNLAGRQRMLSQRLTKAALAWHRSTEPTERTLHLAEVDRVLSDWGAAHERLAHDQDSPGIGEHNSAAVADAFVSIQPEFDAMRAAARALDRDPSALERLVEHEPAFLEQMETIVGLYGREAAGRVRGIIVLEAGLCLVLLAVLAAEGLLVFRPAIRWLRQAIIDQARLRDQELINREMTVAAEVARGIGYDLHDGVGQSLTALTLQARSIEFHLDGHPAAAHLVTLRQGLAEALTQTRAAARRLAPVDIQAIGLEGALRDLAEATACVAGVSCLVECHLELKSHGAEDLYRIAQEAVTNALRHGQARTVTISLRADLEDGVLEVRDDGIGAGAATVASQGLGLRSMRYRAERIGGCLSAGSRSDGGWQVECRFPLRREVPR